MTNPSPARLRVHVEELPDGPAECGPIVSPHLAPLLSAFQQATGWELRHQEGPACLGEVWSTPIDSPSTKSAPRLVLASPVLDQPRRPGSNEASVKKAGVELRSTPATRNGASAAIELQQARPLALALGNLLGEMNRLRHALWQREAELAAGVPIAARPSEEPHLAQRLQSVLKGGAEAVGCQAAGLYLLDDATSELKLRAAWGLSDDCLLAEPRPLQGAFADLEALVGHAVVLEDTSLLPHWRCPEDFPAAVCVPVASRTTPLGTLWMFSDRTRDFSSQETNLIEIIAGRLAAELEREMLLAALLEMKRRH